MRLVYFDFPGRGEAIRDAFRIGAIPFEDERVSMEEFRARRARGDLPFGALPVLVLDHGVVVSQSNTILRYVGKLAGLFPEDPLLSLRVESVLDSAEDYGGRLSVSIRVTDEVVRAALRTELRERWLPDWFGALERLLSESGYLAGPELTIADLKVVHSIDKLTNGSLSGIPREIAEPFRRLCDWRIRVHEARAAALGSNPVSH